MKKTSVTLLAGLLLAAAVVSPAAAIPPPVPGERDMWPRAPGWFLPTGIFLGDHVSLSSPVPSGFTFGAEVSLCYLVDTVWVGALADLRYQPSAEATRYAVGAEAGWAFFGGEFAFVSELRDGETHVGFRLGAVVTASLFGAVLRWEHYGAGTNTLELGVLFKYPIPLQ